MMTRLLFMSLISLSAIGCAASGPGRWAKTLASELRCDMTIKEVEAKAERPVKPLDRAWGTHFVEDGGTDVWLTVENGRLKSYQIAWTRGLKIVEKEPAVPLCVASRR